MIGFIGEGYGGIAFMLRENSNEHRYYDWRSYYYSFNGGCYQAM